MGSSRSRRIAVTLLVSAIVGVGGSRSGPVSAVVDRHLIVSASSAASTSAAKTVSAVCGRDSNARKVIGAGVHLDSPGGHVILTELGLRSTAGTSPTTWVSASGQVNAGSVSWAHTAYAVCGLPPRGLQIEERTSPEMPASSQSITAFCPNTKVVIGTGAEIHGGGGSVVIREMRPDPDPLVPSAVATGEVLGVYDKPWSITVYAVCADPLPGYEVVTAPTPLNSTFTKGAQANCPSGKRLLGTGFEIIAGSGEVGPIQIAPLPAGVSTTAIEHSTYQGDWRLYAHAICAGLNLEVRTSTGGTDSTTPKTLTVTCPGDKQPVAVGWSTSIHDQVLVTGFVPSPSGATVTAHRDSNGKGVSWGLTARVVCANPLPGYEIVSATSITDSLDKEAVAVCPAGKSLVGAGAEVSGAAGWIVIDEVNEFGARELTVSAHETGLLPTLLNWSVTAHAICAYPLAGLVGVYGSTDYDSGAAKSRTATCPSGKQLLLSGYTIQADSGSAVRVASVQPGPTSGPSNFAVSAQDDNLDRLGRWRLGVTGFCVTP